MAQKEIQEYSGKHLLNKHWKDYFSDQLDYNFQSLLVYSGKELESKAKDHTWTQQTGLVIKPDMMFGKRGKNDLVYLKDQSIGDINIPKATQWIDSQTKRDTTLLSGTTGRLNSFIVEPFITHEKNQEFYAAFTTDSHNEDTLFFSDQGGVDIEENWNKKITEIKLRITDSQNIIKEKIQQTLSAPHAANENLVYFLSQLYLFFKDLHFSYLELNPFVLEGKQVYFLDLVARLDDTAQFLMKEKWDNIPFPAPFGLKDLTKEEQYIQSLDQQSGSSLKLTILNPEGKIWTLVAGGGASVVYADTIADKWGVSQMANYGEYSGNPTTQETCEYTKTIFDLMTQKQDPSGSKILLIGGAIANFTDVAKTFKGIIMALEEYADKLRAINVKIYVRRGGPNHEVGLSNLERAGKKLKLPIKVFGPNTHLTDIVSMALKQPQEVA